MEKITVMDRVIPLLSQQPMEDHKVIMEDQLLVPEDHMPEVAEAVTAE